MPVVSFLANDPGLSRARVSAAMSSQTTQQPTTEPCWRLDRDPPKRPLKPSPNQRFRPRTMRDRLNSLKAQRSNQLPTTSPTHLEPPDLRLSLTITPTTNLSDVISYFQSTPSYSSGTSVHTLSLRFAGRAPADQAVLTELETRQTAAQTVDLATLLELLPRVRTLKIDGGAETSTCPIQSLTTALPYLTTLRLHSLTTSSASLISALRPGLRHLELHNVDTSDGMWTPFLAAMAALRLERLKLVDLVCHPTGVDVATALFVHRRARFEDAVDLRGREAVAGRLREVGEWAAVGSLLIFEKAGGTGG